MTTDTITQIDLDQLVESPFNPRRLFGDLAGLAENIKAEGRIHSPLLVRPITRNPLRDDLVDGFEIVFGHRRFRAAQLAGLASAPCMVRAMTTAEARRAQIAENLQRQDVHPIEEAEGFAAMIETEDATAETLAQLVGKSKRYVYARLQLLQACPAVRQACLAGEIQTEVALLVARLHREKLQDQALALIKKQGLQIEDGGARSFRQIRQLLAEHFTLDLKAALFDTTDATLLPGAGACTSCTRRSGNCEAYADLVEARPTRYGTQGRGSADICTDPPCFADKKAAHLAREAAKLEAAGQVVITGTKARAAVTSAGGVKGAFIPLEKAQTTLAQLRKQTRHSADAALAPKVVLVQDQSTGKLIKAVRTADLKAAGVPVAELPTSTVKIQAQNEAQRAAEQAKAEATAKVETLRRRHLLQVVRNTGLARGLGIFELRLCTAALLQAVGWMTRTPLAELHGFKTAEHLAHGIDRMSAPQLTALVLDCLLIDNVHVRGHDLHTKPRPLLELARHYGLDPAEIQRTAPLEPGAPAPAILAPSSSKAPKAPKASKAIDPPLQHLVGADAEIERDTRTLDMFAEAAP